MKENNERSPPLYRLMAIQITPSLWPPKVTGATSTPELSKPYQTLTHTPDSHGRKNSSSKTTSHSHPWSTEPFTLKVTPHWQQKYSGIEMRAANPETWPCD